MARLMKRRLKLRLPAAAVRAWPARRAVERLLSAWPAAFLDLLADTDGVSLVVHDGVSQLAVEGADTPAGGRLTLYLNLMQLAGLREEACSAASSLLVALLAVHEAAASADAAPRFADFYRRLEAARGQRYAPDDCVTASAGSYLAWACAWYLSDRRRLAAEDPVAYRLLHSTLFADEFWRRRAPGTGVTERD